MASNLMILPAVDKSKIRLVRIPQTTGSRKYSVTSPG